MLHLFNRRFTVYRRTGLVLDAATLAASHSASRTPSDAYLVEVEISGSGTAGTVTVSGTSGGGAQSQALAFSAAGRRTTTRQWDASTAVTFTTSGFSGTWTISARAVRKDGSPLRLFTTLQTSWPGRKDRAKGSWPAPTDGSVQVEQATIFLAYTTAWTPREGDELVDNVTSDRWRVESLPLYDDAVAAHHWELSVQRAEA